MMESTSNHKLNFKNKSSSLFLRNIRKFVNNKLAMIGLICIIVILLFTVLGPFFVKHDYNQINIGHGAKAPNTEHLFGTDKLGRDLFARMLYGGRYSILIGFIGAIGGALIGIILGSVSGYFEGWIDKFLVRLSELFQAFPQLVLVLIMVAIMGRGTRNLYIIFPISGWMTIYRIVRNEFYSVKNETFVQVAEVFGMKKRKIMFEEILPNVMSPVIVATTMNIAAFMLQEAALSFLGLGVDSSTPTWGNILNAAKSLEVIKNYYWMWVIPGAVLTVYVLAINFLGDGLRDVLDPKQL